MLNQVIKCRHDKKSLHSDEQFLAVTIKRWKLSSSFCCAQLLLAFNRKLLNKILLKVFPIFLHQLARKNSLFNLLTESRLWYTILLKKMVSYCSHIRPLKSNHIFEEDCAMMYRLKMRFKVAFIITVKDN